MVAFLTEATACQFDFLPAARPPAASSGARSRPGPARARTVQNRLGPARSGPASDPRPAPLGRCCVPIHNYVFLCAVRTGFCYQLCPLISWASAIRSPWHGAEAHGAKEYQLGGGTWASAIRCVCESV